MNLTVNSRVINCLPKTMDVILQNIRDKTGWSVICAMGGPVPENGGEMGMFV